MSYFGAALGAAVGMMIGLVVYSNVWRIKSFLPKEYDFTHEWGKKFEKTDKKVYTYTMRLNNRHYLSSLHICVYLESRGIIKN